MTERGGMRGCEGGSRGSEYVYTDGLFMLFHSRNQQDIVKQLSSN